MNVDVLISFRCSGCRQIKKAIWFTRDEQQKSIKMCYKCMADKQPKADDINDRRTLTWEPEARRHKKVSMTKQEFFAMNACKDASSAGCHIVYHFRMYAIAIPLYSILSTTGSLSNKR